ncbi:hypothetical protein L3X38_004998 [Prunus dulcis]|uniref:RNase H type-1 domain-containing protein n=1 Tax=Prunus dulcis TaxID=3755 RepID=A0AAD4ZQ39_PRUDU|nr:hypothetical protein L3X38_004998 [Prunus dulcis]
MRLNPKKCAFGVSSGQFLGQIVNKRGIEPSPSKMEALRNMLDPRTHRDVRVLTGQITALSRFISRSSDCCKPFFQGIRNNDGNIWRPKQREVFEQLKKCLASPLTLTIPKQGEPLYLYMAVTEIAVSAVLLREENLIQQLIFYVSKCLIEAEKRYPLAEKLVSALLTVKRKLRPYFETHTIIVLTTQPIRTVMSKPDLSGRVTKWAIKFGAFDIRYQPRTAQKGQAQWELYVDRPSNHAGAGVRVIFSSPEGVDLKYSMRLDFLASNNVAEYEALVFGLQLAWMLKVRRLAVHSDSRLIVS